MATQDKISFFVCIDDTARELFSVQERSDGSLIILSRNPQFREQPDGERIDFIDQHYSVHRTKNGLDTTITHKTTLANGTHLSNIAYIHATEQHLLWPIYARRLPIFLSNRSILKPKRNSKDVRIGNFNHKNANLCYSIFVARPTFDTQAIQTPDSKIFFSEFREHKVVVIVTYLNVPSLIKGDAVFCATSSPVINHVRNDDHFQLNKFSVPAEFLNDVHQQLMELLRTKLLDRLRHVLVDDGPAFDWVCRMACRFTMQPMHRPSAFDDLTFT